MRAKWNVLMIVCLFVLAGACSSTSSIAPDPEMVVRYRVAGEPLRVEIAKDRAAGKPWGVMVSSAVVAVGLGVVETPVPADIAENPATRPAPVTIRK
jgi:hypothetical protein